MHEWCALGPEANAPECLILAVEGRRCACVHPSARTLKGVLDREAIRSAIKSLAVYASIAFKVVTIVKDKRGQLAFDRLP